MIGNWLKLLSTAQEDLALTEKMYPLFGDPRRSGGPCLLMTVGRTFEGAAAEEPALAFSQSASAPRTSYRRATYRHPCTIGEVFDALCHRFGTERVNAAIRGRILHNRLVRTLGASVQDPQVSTVGAV